MQKIMYEYGCFDGVFELTGTNAKRIRDECIFPKTRTFNDKPFYSAEKLYYIDLNDAYMSAIKSIPTGENADNGVNTKNKGFNQYIIYRKSESKERR